MRFPKNCTNILLVGLDNSFNAAVAQEIGLHLQMQYSRCEDIVQYHVQERDLILQRVGVEYLKKREKSALEECASYVDCVLSIGFDLFKQNFKLFKQSVICYLQLGKELIKDVKSKLVFEERNQFLEKNSHLTVTMQKRDKTQARKKIIEILGELL